MTDKSSLADKAVAWAEAGIPVFPCNAKKRPMTSNGFYDAEVDPKKVRALFEFFPNAALIGGRMGDGMFAVDIDLYKGDEVEAWYKARIDDGSLVETRTHSTQSGGIHMLYASEETPSCNPVDGVEIKGDGGYIILPDNEGYKEMQGGMVEAPKPLLEILRNAKQRSAGSTIAQLESSVLSGADFHNSLTQIAAKLASQGKNQLDIQDHLIRLMNSSIAAQAGHDRHARWRAVMADSGGELTRMVASAYTKFNDEAVFDEARELLEGSMITDLAGKLFDTLPNFEPPKTKTYDEDKWPFEGQGYFADEEHNLKDINFSMYPIYTENETVVLFAEPKTGKTAVALTTALHIACGMDLGALKVKAAGSCLYYALEGSHAIRLRVKSWKKVMTERGVTLPSRIPMFVVEKPANFIKDNVREEAAAQIIAAYKYAEKAGTPLRVIFIDTLTKAMAGADQNSVEDTSKLFELVNMCREAGVKSTIVFVHHKARTGNVRGSTNIEAEPDMLLDISKKGEAVSLRVARARSIEDGGSFHFALSNVDLGKTEQGHPLHGLFVDPIAAEDAEDNVIDLHAATQLAERRRLITQLGDGCEAQDVLNLWHKHGLIEGRTVRGSSSPPTTRSAAAKKALHEAAPDKGGAVYGNNILRPLLEDGDVVGFTVLGTSPN